ncbi:MAG: MGMT family protein [Bacteroidales bacterium]|jgi:AraC family transcriptional regulator of adaptative response/methylated-DNA-[protein]-cysteine methyltransferase|nr:MGMT family protein [Bacteroidales bacterium]
MKKEEILSQISGTAFQKEVWSALMDIPCGETRSYQQIANAISKPKAVRAVGTAIGKNPLVGTIPCHRVLRSDGGIGGFRLGIPKKIEMLKEEGIIVRIKTNF